MKIKLGILFLSCIAALHGQTIEGKRDALLLQKEEKELRSYLNEVNTQLKSLRLAMEEKYQLVNEYHRDEANEEDYHLLLTEVNQIRAEIADLEKEWHDLAVNESKKDDEGYALWDQEETTLTQLIMEYGSQDYLYIIPPEILSMKLHMHSGIPIPRESWSDLLEIILSHNGIGVKQLNSYTRQLYILKQDLVAVDQVLNDPIDLIRIPPKTRIAYVFSPPPERIKGVSQFFERFRDPKMTFVYQVGYKIAIISSKEEIEKLLALYEAVWEKENEKLTRVLPLTRLKPSEMEKILNAYFGDLTKKPRIGLTKGEGDDLIILPLASEGSLVLIGPKDMVERAEALVKETEGQIEDPMAMTVYWYNCRHSDPIDLAEVLEKVYTALIYSGIEGQEPTPEMYPIPPTRPHETPPEPQLSPPTYGPPPYSTVAHPPTAVAATIESQKEKSHTTNFIPYPKTGAIMMVVRRDTLDKLKELIRNLDVPKKMVQIEVLLFEKRIKNHNNFGLNLLRLGSAATNTHETGFRYETSPGVARKGIVDFFIFRKKPNNFWPAFDIAYNFLMSQEDVRINAAPTVTTLNQTPAQIALVEEISIDNGAAPVNASNGTIAYQQTFSRAQYGTTIVITPTIHDPEHPDDDKHFVTLETNVTFDTIKKNVQNDRPPVSKRHIENHVRVVDGETVILGGLREKTAEDSSSKLPFLGELPGIGKFFGDSRMTDEKTEMFFFITPHIIFDAKGELDKLRREQLTKRPGDLPEFLERIEEAKKRDKKRLFDNSLKLLLEKLMADQGDDYLFAERFGLESIYDLSSYPFVEKKIHKLPYPFVKEKLALPIDEKEGKLVVAIAHPYDLETLEEIRCITKADIQEVFCPKPQLEEAIEKCYHQDEKEASAFIEGLKKGGNKEVSKERQDEYDLLAKQEDSPVIRLLNMILVEAIQQGASDIHFEPLEGEMAIRYRIDGVLQFRHSPPPEVSKQLLTRIKVMAKMDIAEHRLPQDGRIKLSMGGRQIDFRASTVPVVYGERIVLRILDKSNVVLGLDKIGMGKKTLQAFQKYIHQNQGIVLVTGPTGSGKTTTLYSAVNEIHSQEVNVMTIEDPVEYKLPGIAQIGVNPKIDLTFAKGLRHILRQDPDVIMIGEIRDKETAEIAIQSSLTGHLVLSTLHTNDAPSALTRLVDMGIEPYLLSSSVLAILAQRLVRKICDSCKESYKPSSQELKDLQIHTDKLYKGKGCKECFDSGYRGRVGVYELMPVSGEIKKQLLLSVDASGLQRTAAEQGMATLRSEGGLLAKEGITTTAEVLRVTRQLELYQ